MYLSVCLDFILIDNRQQQSLSEFLSHTSQLLLLSPGPAGEGMGAILLTRVFFSNSVNYQRI